MSKRPFTPAIDCTKEKRPHIPLNPVASDKLHAVGYDAATQTFAAQFSAGGAIYHYEGFSQEQHDAFMGAESKGRHFGEHIQILPSKKYSADPVAAEAEADQADDTAQAEA